MRTTVIFLFTLFLSVSVAAQTAAGPDSPAREGSASMTSILPELDKLQANASQAAMNIGHMRIEKWKADADSKRQAQSNADSVQRNLTAALPALVDAVRSSPQDLGAEFKLYRNLNALYDVFASLAESAGAFGPRNEYEALLPQLEVIDSVRRDMGDALERLTASTQSQIEQLRAQVKAAQEQAQAPQPPKKVVVDDTQPTPKKKSSSKKKAPPPSGSDSKQQ